MVVVRSFGVSSRSRRRVLSLALVRLWPRVNFAPKAAETDNTFTQVTNFQGTGVGSNNMLMMDGHFYKRSRSWNF